MCRPNLSLPNIKSSETEPLVSVILPTYGPHQEYIAQAIQSVADQTYESVELIIIDSSDIDWLRELDTSYSWIKYLYQEPVGLPAAWNAGIDAANGQFVGFLSDDDYYTPEKISNQVERLQQGYDVVYADEFVIDEDGRTTYLSSLPVQDSAHHHIDYFKTGQGVPHLTVMGRIECFHSEQFDERLDVREDPHLWFRLFKQYDATKINKALAYKRRRKDSATGDPELLYENELREIDMLCKEYPELTKYRKHRERRAKYRFGKHLFRIGQTGRARGVLVELLSDGMLDYRVIGLLLASFLPFDSRSLFNWLERVVEQRKRYL